VAYRAARDHRAGEQRGRLTCWDAHLAVIRETVDRHRTGAPAPNVFRHARLLLIDTLGCALAGRRAAEVSGLESSLESGPIQLPGGPSLTVRGAAQVLAIAPTWDEACEGHAYAHGRPGIPAIAALLPLALQREATLGEFIHALVAAYEVGARAGGWLRLVPGLHVDGNWPGLGVAAGVAHLLGLPSERAMQAIDIAACQLPYSLYLPVRTGLTSRNLYLAHSATLGMDAAFAAQAGFAAPGDALAEYAERFARADERPLPPAAADLILDGYFKPFAAVRHVHYGAIAARTLRGEQDAKSIHLSVYEEAITYCGNRDPKTPLAAQFSLSFGIAAMLRFGHLDPSAYDEPQFSDAGLRRLEKLVRIEPDRELTTQRRRGARLTIDGRTADTPDSHPDLVLDEAGVLAKFGRMAGRANRFCEAVLSSDGATPIRALWEILCA
jgi:2-methylcitrate dehydratase PrpD